MPRIELGSWIEDAVDFLQRNLSWFFDFVSSVINGMDDGVNKVLTSPEPLVLAGIFAVIALWLRGLLPGVLAFLGFALIDSLELWEHAMLTLSLVIVASVITIVFAVPLGIWAARKRATSAVVRPVLDFMQTMPAFVYLIPGITFFGVGEVPGVIATIIFSMPPGVRMTELGIRQVDKELVEAAEAFGTSPRNTLLRVQFPLALPTIMAGVNQVIMLALSMVVIAGMVGAEGLGADVFSAVSQVNIGLGFEGGLAVVILAMYLDRITAALNQRVSPLGRRALARQNSLHGMKFWHYRPNTAVAVVGVVVLALVAGGMGAFGGSSDDKEPTASDVGKGQTVNMGYIPWDEGIASTFLWKEILEQRGYKPAARSYDVGALWAGMAGGSIDFQTDAWLPVTHESYWSKYKDKLADTGAWYGETSLEIAVPSYVKGVHSLADLKGKGGTFKGRIIGIEPGAGEMKLLRTKVLKDYGLDKEYQLTTGSTASMLAQLERSIKAKEPVAVVLWSPHWAYSKWDLTKLEDPKGSFGKGDSIRTTANRQFAAKNPRIAGWLKNFKMDEKQLTGLEAAVQDAGKGKEQDGVRAWLKKNPGLVGKWAPVGSGGDQKGKDAGKAPKIGYIPWDEDIAATYLWKAVLEKRGYKPEIHQYDIGSMYAAMSRGQVDTEFDAWLPVGQASYWKKYKKDLVDVGAWYDKTSLELAVPSYVKGVHSLADLKGKGGTFKGRIIGIEPGTGEMDFLKHKVLPGYGLEGEYKVVDGSSPGMLAELDRAYQKKEPIVVVLWTPHWAYSQYELTKLADPKKGFGASNQIRTLAHKDFPEEFPEFHGWLKNWHMSEQQLGTLEKEIKDAGKGKEEDAVDKWIDANPGIVDKMAPVS